jgi:hypothetical protein
MFGRRRRTAPVVQVPVAPAPAELSRDQVFTHLHSAVADLIGPDGAWTLVPREPHDTDVIFHGLKAHQIAETLTEILATETLRLRTDTTVAPAHIAEPHTDTPVDGITTVDTGALLVPSGAEPAALPWTPAPISVWAEPQPGSRTGASAAGRLVA